MKQSRARDDMKDLFTEVLDLQSEVLDLHARLNAIEKKLEKCDTLKHICTCPCHDDEDEAQSI